MVAFEPPTGYDTNIYIYTAHMQCFYSNQRHFVYGTCFTLFDPTVAPGVIQADASQHGLGACLLQKDTPIVYASCSLSVSECNYAQIEKKLLAIVFAYLSTFMAFLLRFRQIISHLK